MSLENVQAFYRRLQTDETFQAQIKAAESKLECSQIVQAAGYFFTEEEFEEYTAQLLESTPAEDGLRDLDEAELEAVGKVFGGIGTILPMYGTPVIRPEQSLLDRLRWWSL